MLRPTRKPFSAKNLAQSPLILVPLVWMVWTTVWPGRAYFLPSSTARWKNSSPISVGSPPCQAIVTSGVRCDSTS